MRICQVLKLTSSVTNLRFWYLDAMDFSWLRRSRWCLLVRSKWTINASFIIFFDRLSILCSLANLSIFSLPIFRLGERFSFWQSLVWKVWSLLSRRFLIRWDFPDADGPAMTTMYLFSGDINESWLPRQPPYPPCGVCLYLGNAERVVRFWIQLLALCRRSQFIEAVTRL